MTRRLGMGIIALAIIPIGLFVRFLPLGLLADLAGGMLYAALIYLLAAAVAPRLGSRHLLWITLLWCGSVELLQLSSLPASWASQLPPMRLVFGTGFATHDLLAYLLGALLAWVCDVPGRARRRTTETNS